MDFISIVPKIKKKANNISVFVCKDQVFDFVVFQIILESKDHWFWGFLKNWNQRTVGSGYFKTFKEPTVLMKELVVNIKNLG